MSEQVDTVVVDKNTRSRSALIRYLLVLIVIPLALYFPPFYLVLTPSYERWTRAPGSPVLDYAYQTAGMNADVVMFGESAVKQGIDPSLVSQEIGARVVNLPGSLSTLLVENDLPLRYYLAHNQPPRVIVIFLTAWNFDYEHVDASKEPLYDGEEMLLRHGTKREVLEFFRRYPAYSLQFPLMFYRTNTNHYLLNRSVIDEQAAQVVRTHGHSDTIGVVHDDASCMIPERLIARIRYGNVAELVRRYSTPQTHVMLYEAPIPGCVNADQVVARAKSAIPAPPPRIFPADWFLDDGVYAHVFADHVPAATEEFIKALRPVLAATESGVNGNSSGSVTPNSRQ